MTYLDDLARDIRSALPPDLIPERRANELLLLYALLCASIGTGVTGENVHDAWTVWMIQGDESHESMIPYADLDPEVQVEDDPFVVAIRQVAEERERSQR